MKKLSAKAHLNLRPSEQVSGLVSTVAIRRSISLSLPSINNVQCSPPAESIWIDSGDILCRRLLFDAIRTRKPGSSRKGCRRIYCTPEESRSSTRTRHCESSFFPRPAIVSPRFLASSFSFHTTHSQENRMLTCSLCSPEFSSSTWYLSRAAVHPSPSSSTCEAELSQPCIPMREER